MYKIIFAQQVEGVETAEVLVEADNEEAARAQLMKRSFERYLTKSQDFDRTILDVHIIEEVGQPGEEN